MKFVASITLSSSQTHAMSVTILGCRKRLKVMGHKSFQRAVHDNYNINFYQRILSSCLHCTIRSWSSGVAMIFTATGVPIQPPSYTSPNVPASTLLPRERIGWMEVAEFCSAQSTVGCDCRLSLPANQFVQSLKLFCGGSETETGTLQSKSITS